MSDMSFKQAKELVERMEFSEILLTRAVDNLDQSSRSFQETLKQQNYIINKIPKTNKKLFIMMILVSMNVGFLLGLAFSKFIL